MTPEFASIYRTMMLESLAREMPVTRKVIAAIPDAKRDWKPDSKARSAWELARHLSGADVWFLNSIADLKFPQEEHFGEGKTPNELAGWYEKNMNAGMERVRKMTPQQLMTPVDFYGAYNLPAFAYLEFALKHCAHHRGQLSTYLRPMGSKVPSIYGGSADEPWQG